MSITTEALNVKSTASKSLFNLLYLKANNDVNAFSYFLRELDSLEAKGLSLKHRTLILATGNTFINEFDSLPKLLSCQRKMILLAESAKLFNDIHTELLLSQ